MPLSSPYTILEELAIPPAIIPEGKYHGLVKETYEALQNGKIRLGVVILPDEERRATLHAYIPRVRLGSNYWVRIVPRTKSIFFKIAPEYSKKHGTIYQLIPPTDAHEWNEEEMRLKEKTIQVSDIRPDDFSLSVISAQRTGCNSLTLQDCIELVDKLRTFYSEFEMKANAYVNREPLVIRLNGSGDGKFTMRFKERLAVRYNKVKLDMTFPFKQHDIFASDSWGPLPNYKIQSRLELFDQLTELFW